MAASNSQLVLITGATGYIGSYVAQQLLQSGFRLRVAARNVEKSPKVVQFKEVFSEYADKFDFVEADLLDPTVRWGDLVRDCSFVMHVASSFPEGVPQDEQAASVILNTAIGGTKAIIEAVAKEKSVKKLVITSSIASIAALIGTRGRVYTEDDWIDTDSLPLAQTYEKSKALAEKEAWRIYEALEDPHFSLTCVNPSLVLGPLLLGYSTSLGVVKLQFAKKSPILPRVSIAIVDVRDVATVHVKALLSPEANGKRVIAHAATLTMQEIAILLQQQFGRLGYSFALRTAPDWLFRLASYFDPSVTALLPSLGKHTEYDNSRMRELLHVEPRSVEKTIEETGYSLIELGHAVKTTQYDAEKQQKQQQQQQQQ